MGYISPEGLEHLRTHKYQSTGYTILDTQVMNPFWEAFTRRLPLWLAPNLITLIGTICMILSYAIMTIYDTSFTEQVPLCVLCLSAFLQFMYQTLDACDGKQARRTGSASPLGMLVDHGCDSLSSTVIILSVSQGVALGHDLNMRLLAFGVWGAFYIATWEEYHTHFCRTQVCNFGVTENQFFVMSLFISSGVLGIHFFDFEVCRIFGEILRFRELVLYIMVALSVSTQTMMFVSCLLAANSKLLAVLRLLPFLLLVGAHYCFSHYTQIYHEHTIACLVVCGLFFSLVVGRIIICSVSEVRVT